jgi:hypothetical protein
MKGIVCVRVPMFLFGFASLFYLRLKWLVGSVTLSTAICAGVQASMILLTLVVANEILIWPASLRQSGCGYWRIGMAVSGDLWMPTRTVWMIGLNKRSLSEHPNPKTNLFFTGPTFKRAELISDG